MTAQKEMKVNQRTIQEQLTGVKDLLSAGKPVVQIPESVTASVTRQRQQIPATLTPPLSSQTSLNQAVHETAVLSSRLRNEIENSTSLSRQLQQERLAHQATHEGYQSASGLAFESLNKRTEAVTSREDYVLEEDQRLRLWAAELRQSQQLHSAQLVLLTQLEERERSVSAQHVALLARGRIISEASTALDKRQKQVGEKEIQVELREKQAGEILDNIGYLKDVDLKLKRVEKKLKKTTDERDEITTQRDDLEQQVNAKKTLLSQERREKKLLAGQLEHLQDQLQKTEHDLQKAIQQSKSEVQIRSEATLSWVTQNYRTNGQDVLPINILLVGDGPWSTGVLCDHLQRLDFKVWKDGYSEKCEVVVVGRENWSEAVIDAQIEARENKPLRIYPQELFVLCLAMGVDPFDIADTDALMRFAEGHPAFDYLLGQQFPWPDSKFEVGPPHEPGRGVGVDEDQSSPLYLLGYNVAQNNGLLPGVRHETLDYALSTEPLPWTISDDYMEGWGKAGTSKRLRRIAWHLYLMSKRHGHHVEAVAKWESDLKWLRQTHYKPIQRFSWPN